MGDIVYVWACECRTETPCRPDDHKLGAVFKCPGCTKTFGCVQPRRGGKVWVRISESDVRFHGLHEEPVPEEE